MKHYTETHEWIKADGNIATIGISVHAAEQIGDLVFVELPQIDDTFASGDTVAVLESVKTASDILTPCEGTVTAINEALTDDPELVNRDSEGEGWLFKIQTADTPIELDNLMDSDSYQTFLQQQE